MSFILRTIEKGNGEVSNISLGDFYSVKYTKEQADLDLDIRARVIHPEGEKVIYNSDFSCIMTEYGQTFEVLNRPYPKRERDLTAFKTPTSQTDASELLHEFFNSSSDANKYLEASKQEDLEKDFRYWIKNTKVFKE